MVQIVDAYCTPGTERETVLSVDALLRLMDRARIAKAVVAPQDREVAVANVEGNRRIAESAQRFSDRLIPACTVNPWYGDAAIRELARSAADAARMLVLAPALQGFILTDEIADPLLEEASRLNIPVYVHTGPHSAAAPSQLLLVAARHPAVRFILGHCGSTDYHPDMPAVLAAAPENVWFELSLVRPWSAAQYAASADPSRLLFGSAAPRNSPEYELCHFAEALPFEQYPAVYGENLLRLLEGASS